MVVVGARISGPRLETHAFVSFNLIIHFIKT